MRKLTSYIFPFCLLFAVQLSAQRAGSYIEIESNTLKAGEAVINSTNIDTTSTDGIAIMGTSIPMDFYGVGGSFKGGYIGTVGTVQTDSSQTYYGTVGEVFGRGRGTNYGVAGFSEGLGTNYGIYGSAVGGVNNYAGYFDGDAYVASNFQTIENGYFSNNKIALETFSESGRISLFDRSFNRKIQLFVSGNSNGILDLFGSTQNNRNVILSSPLNYPDNGYVAVYNSSGGIRSGMYVSPEGLGVVFSDVKNFRMDHPTKANKEIWYASLEGPEAAAYERGTASLENGEIFVEFTEHFGLVGNPKTMTVILTPLSSETYGLAVVEKTASGFKVKELMGGKGNFQFDWEVKAVRKGYENFRVIRDANEIRPVQNDSVPTITNENNNVSKLEKTNSPHLNDPKKRLRK